MTADPSGYGQGQTYLGSESVTTDDQGNVTFSATLSVGSLAGLSLRQPRRTRTETHPVAMDLTITASTARIVAVGDPMSPANVDQALQSLALGVLDQAAFTPFSGISTKTRNRTSL